jgi:hypothetical protein
MRSRILCGGVLVGAALLLAAPAATPQLPRPIPGKAPAVAKGSPKLVAVAETRLLMDGLTLPNFKGAEGLLRKKPDDAEAWKFLRGQALIIAETGNLLMVRPPRNKQAQTAWFNSAANLRSAAKALGESAASRDFERSRTNLVNVANACNRCHQTFRVATEVEPFAEPGGGEKKTP